MRLLKCNSSGELSLTQDFGSGKAPEYAILSHTWGPETQEVTYRDLIDCTGENKTGYEKIRFCQEQVRRDGLSYFWVDTCCIDKFNAVELQEAINSMFRWYKNAVKCYVYLSDVSIKKRKASDSFTKYAWEPAFRSSRWFTRGWTLQELLAPASVEFFSQERDRLGDKRSLEKQIYEITGIPLSALRETPIFQFDIEDRFAWAEHRQTTREEDMAYSLFGIFDIQIPLLYGEGKGKALKRLREEINKFANGGAEHFGLDRLDYLPSASNAPFNSVNTQDEALCLPETRVELLREIYDWADGQDERCIFWLSGFAGTGKSTIARTIARKSFEDKCLAASFFFSKGGGDVSNAEKFFTSIAVQLVHNIPSLRQYICDAATRGIADQSFRDQWSQLILGPLSRLDSCSPPSYYILIVDALDECENEEHIRIILKLLAEARVLKTVRLRIFLTSRPEIPIRHGFSQIPESEHHDLVLHNILPSIINHDIGIFLQYNLKLIASERSLGPSWPGQQIVERLVSRASGLFIWAAIAYRFIREGKRFAVKRLDMILNHSGTHAPEKHLDEIYLAILRQSISPTFTTEEAEEAYYTIKTLLGSIVSLFSPLSGQSLSKLFSASQEELYRIVDDLHAVLDIPKDQTRLLRLHHPSFRDFLFDKERCIDSNFRVDERQAHQNLANSCIRLMSGSLKQNICKQKDPGILVTNVNKSLIEMYLPPEMQYACLYWVQHLKTCRAQICDTHPVYQFLQDHLLHWLEALSWIGKFSNGILAIISLEALIIPNESPNLYTFMHHTKRFVVHNRSAIEKAPLQLYCPNLIFTPEKSIIQGQFGDHIPALIQRKPKVRADWSAALQTFKGHSSSVWSVAFSPDSTQVVSGSDDQMILWDAATGLMLRTLEGHLGRVTSVAFSPDGKQIVSGSDDETAKLWDTTTGVVIQTLKDNSGWVATVGFSPNGKQVASGSDDQKVRLWDTATGSILQTLEGHSGWIATVAFSPDSTKLASGAGDQAIRIWNTTTGAVLQTLKGNPGWFSVWSVAFSPDGNQVVSGAGDETVRLWDTTTGAVLQTFEGHWDWVWSVAFSPDGKQVVSGSNDRTIRLWNVATGEALETLEGQHSGWVSSVAFSPDGKQVVSGSGDQTVRLWNVATGRLHPAHAIGR